MPVENILNEVATELKRLMSLNNIESLIVDYFGEGDSGEITNIDISSEGPVSKSVEGEITNRCWDIIESTHAGFAINEGGGGQINAILKNGKLKISHDYFDNVPCYDSSPVIEV